jgi:hypothetical protein
MAGIKGGTHSWRGGTVEAGSEESHRGVGIGVTKMIMCRHPEKVPHQKSATHSDSCGKAAASPLSLAEMLNLLSLPTSSNLKILFRD